jgi:hypothetical protein
MWSKLAFRFLRDETKVEILKAQGMMLGSRCYDNRRVFLYALKDFFVEVKYRGDDVGLAAEVIETFSSLGHLNRYLEHDFRSAF